MIDMKADIYEDGELSMCGVSCLEAQNSKRVSTRSQTSRFRQFLVATDQSQSTIGETHDYRIHQPREPQVLVSKPRLDFSVQVLTYCLVNRYEAAR